MKNLRCLKISFSLIIKIIYNQFFQILKFSLNLFLKISKESKFLEKFRYKIGNTWKYSGNAGDSPVLLSPRDSVRQASGASLITNGKCSLKKTKENMEVYENLQFLK